MDDKQILSDILRELKELRKDVYTIVKEQRELANIVSELKSIERLLEKKL